MGETEPFSLRVRGGKEPMTLFRGGSSMVTRKYIVFNAQAWGGRKKRKKIQVS